MILFFLTIFALAFALSQSGKVRKVYNREPKTGKFAKVEAKKEKRIVIVKRGTQIVNYFAI